jgi:hypothetical protein
MGVIATRPTTASSCLNAPSGISPFTNLRKGQLLTRDFLTGRYLVPGDYYLTSIDELTGVNFRTEGVVAGAKDYGYGDNAAHNPMPQFPQVGVIRSSGHCVMIR